MHVIKSRETGTKSPRFTELHFITVSQSKLVDVVEPDSCGNNMRDAVSP